MDQLQWNLHDSYLNVKMNYKHILLNDFLCILDIAIAILRKTRFFRPFSSNFKGIEVKNYNAKMKKKDSLWKFESAENFFN